MQLTTTETTVQTMSSREIAKLTGKTHKNVRRDIDNMFEQLGLDKLTFEHIYLDGSNRKQKEYQLPRRECEILVTGYDVKRRAAVIDRWFDLESTKALTSTGNPIIDALVSTQMQLNQQAEEMAKVTSDVTASLSAVADMNQEVSKLKKGIEMVNKPMLGYITAGEAVRTIFPEVSKGALITMLARYGSKSKSYTFFVEGNVTGKVGTTQQYPIKDVKAIKKDIMDNASQISTRYWTHTLNAKFTLNK